MTDDSLGFFGLDRSTAEPVIVEGATLTREMVESLFRAGHQARILRVEDFAPPAFLMGDWREPTPKPVEMTLPYVASGEPESCQPPPKRSPRRGPVRPVRPPIVWRTR